MLVEVGAGPGGWVAMGLRGGERDAGGGEGVGLGKGGGGEIREVGERGRVSARKKREKKYRRGWKRIEKWN